MLARPPALLLDEPLTPPPATTDLRYDLAHPARRDVDAERVHLSPARQVLPYVVTTHYIAQRDALFARDGLTPEGAFGLPRVGGDLYLALARDLGDGLRILFPSDVARDDLDWSECIDEAQENLRAKVGTRELPLAVHEVSRALTAEVAPWRPGTRRVDPTEKILVIGPSWLAASCLAHPALPTGAASRLGASRLMALLPHRDRLFVFADRGIAANSAMAAAIRAIEEDAPARLPSVLYRLEAYGAVAV
jgi:hypothetical protein